MPDAEVWLLPVRSNFALSGIDESLYEWSPAVVEWWNDIWTSPMASEFVNSDIHSLYLGCFYLDESLCPLHRMTDRIAAGKMFEQIVKNFGLNPSARESLKWQVAQGAEAESRTTRARERAKQDSKPKLKPVSEEDLYRRNA